jgi:hypothetical protein
MSGNDGVLAVPAAIASMVARLCSSAVPGMQNTSHRRYARTSSSSGTNP